MEYHVHQFYKEARVCKMSTDGDLTDGGTEWFLVEQGKLVDGVAKIGALMQYIYGDGA